jgi:hypothetical protein
MQRRRALKPRHTLIVRQNRPYARQRHSYTPRPSQPARIFSKILVSVDFSVSCAEVRGECSCCLQDETDGPRGNTKEFRCAAFRFAVFRGGA